MDAPRPIVGEELERLIASAPSKRHADIIRREGAQEVSGSQFLKSLDDHIARKKTSWGERLNELSAELARLK